MKILLTQGEIEGIAPEITEKLELHDKIFEHDIYILRGKNTTFKLKRIKSIFIEDILDNKFDFIFPSELTKNKFLEYKAKLRQFIPINDINEQHFSILSVYFGAVMTYLKITDVLITNPIDKHIISSFVPNFSGHTAFLKRIFNVDNVLMLMKGHKLPAIGILTEHIPLKLVAESISISKIISSVKLIKTALKTDMPIAVAGLNPHAGDNGLISDEEEKIIKPAIALLQREGISVSGPHPADSLFIHKNMIKFGAILTLYHDQGMLIPKTLAFDSLVNISLGLPIIRTSPGHGVAYDIVGKGLATEKPLYNAVQEAIFMAK